MTGIEEPSNDTGDNSAAVNTFKECKEALVNLSGVRYQSITLTCETAGGDIMKIDMHRTI